MTRARDVSDLETKSSRHMRILQPLGRLFLWLFGWKIDGAGPTVPKAVIIAYPHTTNWDMPITLAIAFALGFRMHWLGKAAIFRPPFGRLMRWLGGIPVIRSRSTNLVTSIVESLADRDEVYVIIPPEGTRSKSGHWKSGFYWVVVEAGIPIILGYLDYARREGGLGETFVPSGDLEADLEKIREFYSGVEGKYPDLQGEITLEDVDR
jgi:1-acyl-sn-glycerol-3-phosphate acyltransferase